MQTCTRRHIMNSNSCIHMAVVQKGVLGSRLGWRQRHTLRAATTARASACRAPMGSRFTMPPKDLKATTCAAGAAARNKTIKLRVELSLVGEVWGEGAGGQGGSVSGEPLLIGLSIERHNHSHWH